MKKVEAELAGASPDRDTLLTIGVFDGVHLGHKYLISRLVEQAKELNLLPGVVTFRQHPQELLSPQTPLPLLTSLEERTRLLKNEGVKVVAPLSFTEELSNLTARDFAKLLQQHLKMRGLLIGPDFALGKNREGDAAALRKLGKELGFSVTVVPPARINGEVASSTAIRKALATGDVRKATRLAGRPFRLGGSVVSGSGRGTGLGFPTANLAPNAQQALPADGVYATLAHLNGNAHPSLTNIGTCPTFGGVERRVEVYIIDYKGNLYGRDLKVDFVERLRAEKQFQNVDELKQQMAEDMKRGQAILASGEQQLIMAIDTKDLTRLLKRGVTEIISEQELIVLLQSGKKLRLKEGFDPSFPDIHLGHVVALRKLRQFQELGHQVVLIVGDWTAQIGDPSGVSVTRPMLTAEKVRANAETYMKQFFKVVDKNKTEVRWQSEWFGKFTLTDVIRLTSKFTVAQFLAREDFNQRYTAGKPISLVELLYPLLQAYDSVAVNADVEFGGQDQKFNFLVGRELQTMLGQRPQQCFMTPLLVGTDGSHKMSKSLGNYIGVDEAPDQIYGKVMSIADSLIIQYFELVTDVKDEEIAEFKKQLDSGTNPMTLKKRLARELVSQLHSQKEAQEAEEQFEKVVQKRELPAEVPEVKVTKELLAKIQKKEPLLGVGEVGHPPDWYMVSIPLLLFEVGVVKSRSEAKRLVIQGAVDVDDNTVTMEYEGYAKVRVGSIVKAGKRRFVKIVID